MQKNTALFLSSGLLIITVLGLISCSAPGPKTLEVPSDILISSMTKKTEAQLRIQTLEQSIRQAQQAQNWPDYLKVSEQLWQLADAENQLAIEYTIWQTLQSQFNSPSAIALLENSPEPGLKSWASLLNALQQPGLFKRQALQDLNEFEDSALYQSHLIQALQWRFKNQQPVRQLGVLLPFTGKYQHIGQQIRNGLLKAYMVSDQSIALKFYDSGNIEQVLAQYYLAKKEGADLVIGPLSKEAIAQFEGQNIHDIIALNSSDDKAFKSFNFRTQSEGMQITQHLAKNAFSRIGILSSENPRDMSTAQDLLSQWLMDETHQAVLHPYSLNKLNLRKALGGLINEENSQARYNNLRWLLGEKLEFFPRTRKDLQAIVLVGKVDQVAVFHPQFEFFLLDMPVYATSNLTPNNLHNIERNKDLGKVIFPTIPAVFSANALNSDLEAFGWDSFILASQLHNLAPNLCLNQGQSGILYLNGQEINKKLIWAQYTANGQLAPWVAPVEKNPAPLTLEQQMELERLEALKEEASGMTRRHNRAVSQIHLNPVE